LHTGNEIVQNLSSERPAEAEKETVSDETTPSGAPLRPSADAWSDAEGRGKLSAGRRSSM